MRSGALARILGGGLVCGTAALLLVSATVGAHALLQSADPPVNATLATPPTSVTIRFGEAPDPKLSTIKVLDASGNPVSNGSAQPVAGNALELRIALNPLGDGVYTVSWRTVSAVDGHVAAGSYAFGVGVTVGSTLSSGAGGAVTGSGNPSFTAIIFRWILYGGLFVLLGASMAHLWVLKGIAGPPSWLTLAGLMATAIGVLGVVAVQISEAGVAIGDVLGTSLGTASVTRLSPLPFALAGAVVAWRGSGRIRRSGLVVLGAAAAATMLADVAASHAAAEGSAMLNSAVQAFHIVAAGVWIGGLAALVLAIRGLPTPDKTVAIRRFSVVATVAIGVVAVTGLLRAVAELTSIDQLWTTDFGRLLVLKSALVGGLALLAAVNHFRNVPLGAVAAVRRVGTLELSVAATILLATAMLVNLAPPVELASAGSGGVAPGNPSSPSSLTAAGSDFGTTVRLQLTVSPGLAGFNTFTADVSDYDSRAPAAAAGVTLRFALPARTDVGGSSLRLNAGDPGAFSAGGANLSLAGQWTITALVDRGTQSVEVPLTLQVPLAPQQVDVNAASGQPTLYTVHLGGGLTVQVYLDPGSAGGNDVHSTFFDASGNELPVQQASMTMQLVASSGGAGATAAAPPSAPASQGPAGPLSSPLPINRLEPGHFMGRATLVAGTYELEITAPAPTGETLFAHLHVTVAP